MLYPKTDEHVNPSVEVHHLVGKLSTAETLLKSNVTVLVINVCNQGKTLCSPCSSNVSYKKNPEDLMAFISRPNRKNALKCMLPASFFLIDK